MMKEKEAAVAALITSPNKYISYWSHKNSTYLHFSVQAYYNTNNFTLRF